MPLTPERRAALKNYCRIDEDNRADDILLGDLYDAAVGYLDGAGVSEPKADTSRRAQYDLCVNALVLEAYDRRATTVTGTVVNENPAFRRMVNQLKLTEPASAGKEVDAVSNSDTDAED